MRPNGRADVGTKPDHARDLADELRGIAEALATRDLADNDLVEAAALARELRSRLQGPVRQRWYEAEGGAKPSPDSSSSYLDQSPVRGLHNPVAPPLVTQIVERPDGTRILEGRTRLGSTYEGPPHGVHGGWVAALFDEVLGAAQGLSTSPGVTAILRVRYRHLTPIDEDLLFEGWIHKEEGRRLTMRATCRAGDLLTADAEGIFLRVDFKEIQKRMQERRQK